MTESTLTAEIVTFRTHTDTPEDDVRRAAAALAPFLSGCEGFVSRSLSRDGDGIWTDHILWANADLAKRAAAQMMEQASAAAFLALIDVPSVRMIHARVLVEQKAA